MSDRCGEIGRLDRVSEPDKSQAFSATRFSASLRRVSICYGGVLLNQNAVMLAMLDVSD